ncbi:IS66 family transposase [Anaerostipes sp. 494a]|uniref:IS66 family transposase n=1 Tax=Anaerostipes sp. 494a TaxID=1261636 RepID=UPI000A444551|nr:IS66 family transposase [Anaerostipes sp. 494a]
MTKDEMNEQLLQQVNSLTATVDSLNATIAAQTQLIAQLNQTIQELKEQLNKNSKNSSKPPSSDGLKKPAPKSLRKSSGKKVGAQNGHPGTNLAVTTAPDETIKHMPSACEGCPHYKMCKGTACISEKRHVIDAVVTVNVTEHQVLEIPICMLHGGTRKGEFPSDVKASVQYGENLQALSVALNTVGAVSIKRTHEILSGVFNIPIATGTISNMVKRCADGLCDIVEKIKQKMQASALGHFDETGTRVDKKLWWVHNASNCDYTYLDISPKRGFKGMEQCGVLTEFHGIAMHDCWASYWNYPEVTHAVCCAHLLRELTGITENHPEQKWASAFIDLLLEMKKVKDKAVAKGNESLSYYYSHKFDKQYDELIEQARKENPLPETTEKKRGRKKKGKILALVERLANYKASVCLFIKNFEVPFDNNQAERDIRMIKVKTKVSGCFRTEEGARDYLKIMSYIGTAHKQGYNAYEAIKNAISGNPDFIFG